MSLSQSPAVIHSGWLTKSPPTESASLFKPRWRKRWMVLLQGSDSESYLLCYYTDESKTKLKGTINLKHCMTISSSLLVPPSSKSKQVSWLVVFVGLKLKYIIFRCSCSVSPHRTESTNSLQTTSS